MRATPVSRLPARLAALVIITLASWTAAGQGTAPTVVELFTSQGCYSCPPAEALLGELARREGVIALEFHVDYWNDLVYGSAGRWVDVFSTAAFTSRQRRYADRIPGSGVYTPQIVVDGAEQTVGSKRRQVLRLIQRAPPKPIQVSVRPAPAGGITVALATQAPGTSAAILLARYDRQRTTSIKAGENKGKTLTSYHVVRELRRVGDWHGSPMTLQIANPDLQADQGCAVLVQSPGQGPILGAAACPI